MAAQPRTMQPWSFNQAYAYGRPSNSDNSSPARNPTAVSNRLLRAAISVSAVAHHRKPNNIGPLPSTWMPPCDIPTPLHQR